MIGIIATSVPFGVAMVQFIVCELRPISVVDGMLAEPRSLSSSMSKDNVWDN